MGDDFIFFSDQLMRLVIQDSISMLPQRPVTVTTPTGDTYTGTEVDGPVCTVSILRSGEAMESSARALMKGVRFGKVLVQRNEETHEPEFYFAKLPEDIKSHNVILLDPMVATGGSANMVLECI